MGAANGNWQVLGSKMPCTGSPGLCNAYLAIKIVLNTEGLVFPLIYLFNWAYKVTGFIMALTYFLSWVSHVSEHGLELEATLLPQFPGLQLSAYHGVF